MEITDRLIGKFVSLTYQTGMAGKIMIENHGFIFRGHDGVFVELGKFTKEIVLVPISCVMMLAESEANKGQFMEHRKKYEKDNNYRGDDNTKSLLIPHVERCVG